MSFELVESVIVFLVVILLFRWATFNLGFTNAHGIVLFYRVFPVIKVSIARPEHKEIGMSCENLPERLFDDKAGKTLHQ